MCEEEEKCVTCPADCGTCPLTGGQIALIVAAVLVVTALGSGAFAVKLCHINLVKAVKLQYLKWKNYKQLYDDGWIYKKEELLFGTLSLKYVNYRFDIPEMQKDTIGSITSVQSLIDSGRKNKSIDSSSSRLCQVARM